MRQQYIKGGDNKPFVIVEDDRNDQNTPKPDHAKNLHRYRSRQGLRELTAGFGEDTFIFITRAV